MGEARGADLLDFWEVMPGLRSRSTSEQRQQQPLASGGGECLVLAPPMPRRRPSPALCWCSYHAPGPGCGSDGQRGLGRARPGGGDGMGSGQRSQEGGQRRRCARRKACACEIRRWPAPGWETCQSGEPRRQTKNAPTERGVFLSMQRWISASSNRRTRRWTWCSSSCPAGIPSPRSRPSGAAACAGSRSSAAAPARSAGLRGACPNG